jgi:ribose 5-phosphate isomerase A
MNAKHRAAAAALAYIKNGMTLGLGTGSTAKIFIDLLGAEIAAGRLRDIRGIPTSIRSAEQAMSLNIPLTSFTDTPWCDITIDGADEISPTLDLIKGLGGALMREKIVAQNARQLIIIADDSKRVDRLGVNCPLPVEVAPFSRDTSARFLRSLGAEPTLRLDNDQQPYMTDNANLIFDCAFGSIDNPGALDRMLRTRAGIVETGLFVGIAHLAIIGHSDGISEITR